MKYTDEHGDTYITSHMTTRMWRIIIALIVLNALMLLAITGMLTYFFWWVGKNDVIVHLFRILEECKCQ